MFKKFALASIVFMFLGLVLAVFQTKDAKPNINPMAIVRLHDPLSGRFFCSGTVINDTQILTAAHCVVDQYQLRPVVEVRVVSPTPTRIKATVESFSIQNDIAILTGNFKKLPKIKIEKNNASLMEIWANPKRHVVACGYPYGAALTCVPITQRDMYWFLWRGQGRLYPGMSGGPVIDMETSKVIGSNTAVTQEFVILAPVIRIEQILQIFIP